jgi:hypothetical protein
MQKLGEPITTFRVIKIGHSKGCEFIKDLEAGLLPSFLRPLLDGHDSVTVPSRIVGNTIEYIIRFYPANIIVTEGHLEKFESELPEGWKFAYVDEKRARQIRSFSADHSDTVPGWYCYPKNGLVGQYEVTWTAASVTPQDAVETLKRKLEVEG